MENININKKSDEGMSISTIDNTDVLILFMYGTLTMCAEAKDYYLLQKMCESAHITNQKVYEKSHENRPIGVSPENAIFTDMVLVLCDEAKTNAAIIDLFYENGKAVFSKQYKKYLAFKEAYRRNPVNGRNYFDDKVKYREQYIFFFFINYEREIVDDSVINEHIRKSIEHLMNFIKMQSASDFGVVSKYVFNTGEQVFPSMQFDKYLTKQRKKLVDCVNKNFDFEFDPENDYDELGVIIRELMRSVVVDDKKDPSYGFSMGLNQICLYDVEDVVLSHGGAPLWYITMTSKKSFEGIEPKHYEPDVDELIRRHFKNCIMYRWGECEDNHEDFTKVKLARECEGLGGDSDLYAILYLYILDIVYKMFDMMKETYYLNFSWESISNKVISSRYEDRLREMQNTINSLNSKLRNSIKNNQLQKDVLDKKNGADVALRYERELADMGRKMEKKDEEILFLKTQLAIKDEYIELLSKTEDTVIEREVDVENLQSKRYLFVGWLDKIPEIRYTFPGSIFMESEQKSLSGIKVDAIVLLIKNMSHKMFYKIKSSSEMADVPIIYCNTSNFNTILNDMSRMDL